jgi:translation initiation factor 1A
MPKKSSKNKKFKEELKERDLIYKEDMQEYAKVEALLGDKRCTIKLLDGSEKLAIIGGKLKKKRIWINKGNIILVSFRDFQTYKVDVIHKYNDDEVKKLTQYQELDASFLNPDTGDLLHDDNLVFTNDDEPINLDDI